MGGEKGRAGYEFVDLAAIPAVPCPCGVSRRGFADVSDYPGTIHLTDVSREAVTHYHRRMTEVYYILECGENATMELDGDVLRVRPGMCVLIRPGTRHRAIGPMKILNIVTPKFDPSDEWFDETPGT